MTLDKNLSEHEIQYPDLCFSWTNGATDDVCGRDLRYVSASNERHHSIFRGGRGVLEMRI